MTVPTLPSIQKLACHPIQPSKAPPKAGANIGVMAIPIDIYAIFDAHVLVSFVSRTIARASTMQQAANA